MKMQKCLAGLAGLLIACGAQAATLIQQIGAPSDIVSNAFRWSTQRFEPGLAGFNANFIDDFTISGGSMRLTRFDAVIWGFQSEFSGFGNVSSWSLEIYSSVAAAGNDLAGDVASLTIAAADVNVGGPVNGIANSALLSLDLSASNLQLGDAQYWIGVIPRMDRSFGQIAVFTSQFAGADPGGSDAYQVNPAGGFGFGPSILREGNAAFNLEAQRVPEPAGLAVLGLGLLMLQTRRR